MPCAIGAVLSFWLPLTLWYKKKAAETPMIEISAAKVRWDGNGNNMGLMERKIPF